MDLSQFTFQNKFLMLALDHRGSFRKLINSQNPQSVSSEEIIDLKSKIIDSLKDQFSSLLVDVEWGLPALKNLNINRPYLLPVEKSGYEELEGQRMDSLEYSAQQLKNLGAAAIKLVIQFNPYTPNSHDQMKLVKEVLSQSKDSQLPLFFEIVTYDYPPIKHSRTELIMESVKTFVQEEIVPDVFKLEYPGGGNYCTTITNLLGKTPWILLTEGEDFETFKKQLEDAVSCGASGFLAGRALWKEIFTLTGEEQDNFLKTTLPSRFAEISDIVLNK